MDTITNSTLSGYELINEQSLTREAQGYIIDYLSKKIEKHIQDAPNQGEKVSTEELTKRLCHLQRELGVNNFHKNYLDNLRNELNKHYIDEHINPMLNNGSSLANNPAINRKKMEYCGIMNIAQDNYIEGKTNDPSKIEYQTIPGFSSKDQAYVLIRTGNKPDMYAIDTSSMQRYCYGTVPIGYDLNSDWKDLTPFEETLKRKLDIIHGPKGMEAVKSKFKNIRNTLAQKITDKLTQTVIDQPPNSLAGRIAGRFAAKMAEKLFTLPNDKLEYLTLQNSSDYVIVNDKQNNDSKVYWVQKDHDGNIQLHGVELGPKKTMSMEKSSRNTEKLSISLQHNSDSITKAPEKNNSSPSRNMNSQERTYSSKSSGLCMGK